MLTVLELSRLLAGGYFVWTGSSKVGRPAVFWNQIMGYRLSGPRVSGVLASVIPPLELIGGLFFAAGIYPLGSGVVLGVLLILFSTAMAASLLRRLENDCGCGQSPSPVRPALFVRNLGLGVLIAMGIYSAAPDSRSNWIVAVAGALVVVIAFAAAYRTLQK